MIGRAYPEWTRPELVDKLNEVISTVNDLESHVHHLLERNAVRVQQEVTKESAKRTITTPPGRELHLKNNGEEDLVLAVEQGSIGPEGLVPPKKEETPTDRTLTREEVEQLAVEAYKKRLVERLQSQKTQNRSAEAWPPSYDSGIEAAVKLVEETF